MAARLTAYFVACIVGVTLIAGLIVGAQRDEDGPVDLIIVNGKVFGAAKDAAPAEAVAVQGNKVLRVGSTREIQRLRRAQTTVIDARGGSILPGFNDAHADLSGGGLALDQLNLLDALTLAEVKDTIEAWARAHPQRTWIRGRGWNATALGSHLLTRQLLDTLVPDRPAYFVAHDGRSGWANTQALALAGITVHTRNPDNGVIVKDAGTGEPAGVLHEAAMTLMDTALPVPTREDRMAALRAAIGEAHRAGVTSVQSTTGEPDDLALLDELRRRGELTLRVYLALGGHAAMTAADLDALEQVRERFADDPLLKTGAVRLVADGSVESRTAAMLEPYEGQPTTTGRPAMSQEELTRTVTMLDRRGWQVMIDAVGDAAVRVALDAYQVAASSNTAPARGRRHRIEHVETVAKEDVPRFAALGVIATLQPTHGLPPAPDEEWRSNLGPEGSMRGWLVGSILSAGGRLAFGTDWPVAALEPRLGVFAVVNRTSVDGVPDGGWNRRERLSLRQAIEAYTSGAAWASFDDQRKGTLERNMLADIVILSADIFALPAGRLLEAKVVMTIADGKVVYRRDAPEPTTEH